MATKLEIPNLPDVPYNAQFIKDHYEMYEYFQKIKEMFDTMLGRNELSSSSLIPVQGKQDVKRVTGDYVVSTNDLGKSLRTWGPNEITVTLPSVNTDYDGYRITIIKGNTGILRIQVTGDRYVEESALGGHIECSSNDKDEVITFEYVHLFKRWVVIGEHGWTQYGEIYGHDVADDLTTASVSTWYQIVSFAVNGESNGCTPDHTNDHITVHTAGTYQVHYSVSAHGHQSHDYDIHVARNNNATDFDETATHFSTPTAGRVISMSGSGILTLAAGDTIELWILRSSAGSNIDVTFDHINLNITRIH